jgi:DNA-binding transcriptional ArsR family regulator
MNSDVFAALSDPTRRAILSRLTTGEATVTDLVERFHLTQPTISRHVQALERAGLVGRRRDGQARPIALRPDALREVDDWLEPFRAFWTASPAHLEAHAKAVADADHDDAPKR